MVCAVVFMLNPNVNSAQCRRFLSAASLPLPLQSSSGEVLEGHLSIHKSPAALAEDSNSVPSTHVGQYTVAYPWGPLLASVGTALRCTYTCTLLKIKC